LSLNSNSAFDLGLMGGMFDPVHNGHLNIALSSLKNLQLDELHLLPCGTPVHRESKLAESKHRLAMLELAISAYTELKIDDRECKTLEPSYTRNSLLAIRRERPDCRLFFIMGQDAFNSLNNWYNWKELFSLAHIVVAARPGIVPEFAQELQAEYQSRSVASISELKKFDHGKILTSYFEAMDISSSRIRKCIANNESISELVPQAVEKYLRAHNLYKGENSF